MIVRKLSLKVTAGVLVILSMVLFSLGYFTISGLRQQMTDNLQLQGEQLSAFLIKTSLAPIKNYRFFFLREYALKLEEFPQVAYCNIFDRDGESLVDLDSTFQEGPAKKAKVESDNILVIKQDIVEDDYYYGHVEIGLYLDEVQKQIRDKSLRLAGGLFAILIIVAVLLRWFLNKILVSPVIALSESTRKLTTGDFSGTDPSKRQDEIGQLINNFNTMNQHLKTSFEEIESKNQAIQSKNDELSKIDSELRDLNKHLEEKVESRTQKLKQSLSDLSEAQNKLVEVEKMASLGRLVSGVAHEINTPIGVCITALSHANDEARLIKKQFESGTLTKGDLEKYILIQLDSNLMLRDNLDRAASLVKSFKLASIEDTPIAPDEFRLGKVIDYVIEKYRDEYSNIEINVTCDPELTLVSYFDVYAKIIENILLNSFQHGYEHDQPGSVSLVVSIKDNRLLLEYDDNGKGMTEEALHNIFEPFYTTKRGSGGTGLGMHIVYNMVTQKLKGDIRCTSTLNNGIHIIITVPLV